MYLGVFVFPMRDGDVYVGGLWILFGLCFIGSTGRKLFVWYCGFFSLMI